MDVCVSPGPAVRAARMTGHGAGAECLVNDGLDGARASAAFSAAAEAAIDLLGIAWKVFRGVDGIAHVMVAEDVAGTYNHENAETLGDAAPSIFKIGTGCKRKNRLFKRFQTDPLHT